MLDMKNMTNIKTSVRALLTLAVLIGFAIPSNLFAYTPAYVPAVSVGPRGIGGGYSSGRPVASGVSVSCAPSSLAANVGQTVTWVSSVSGGSGAYLYNWNGTDGLSGNVSTTLKAYATNGEKLGTLTVTSGNRAITVSCGTVLIQGSATPGFREPGFGASCYATPERAAPGESVTWLAILSGITASTTYMWDGTDGLSGDRPLVTKTYTTLGIKPAMLTVTKGNERIVAPCTNAVTVAHKIPVIQKPTTPIPPTPTLPSLPRLEGLCTISTKEARVNDEVVWRASAVGGTGTYDFLWTGDEELSGEASTTRKAYEKEGVKNAKVVVTSGESILTLSCPPLEVTKSRLGLLAALLLSWITGPFLIILGLILAIFIGILFARRKKKQDEKEEERDHVA